jgi:hypothetical protein
MTNQPKNKGGRPRLDIDPQLVEKLAGIGCPDTEIASMVNCSVDTLARRYADVIAKGRETCKTRLRKKQIEVALAGNVSMLIFLGKNMLGQSDKLETKAEITPGAKLEVTPELEQKIKAIAERQANLQPPQALIE